MDLTKRLGLSKDLLNSAAAVLGEKKISHPNQKVISTAASPKGEITAADFKALKAKKSKFKVEGFDRKGKPYMSPIFESEHDAQIFARKVQYTGALKSVAVVEIEGASEAVETPVVMEAKEVNTANASAEREHDCAKHVVHEEWGVGQTVPTMHAEPDADGNIAWYDVMFEHGIEQQVATSNLNVVLSEKHKHKFMKEDELEVKDKVIGKGKKNAQIEMNPVHPKKMKEEVEIVTEGRNADPIRSHLEKHEDARKIFSTMTNGKGRHDSYFHVNPKGKYRKEAEAAVTQHKKSIGGASSAGSNGSDSKTPDHADADSEANQHPINKLRGIMDRNGGTMMGHKLTRGHAAKLISQHDALKPSQRQDFIAKIGHHIKNVVG